MRRLFLLTLVLAALFLGACGITDPQSNETLIREQLSELEHAFNNKQINSIVAHLQPGYLHNGMNSWHFTQLWQDRMTRYVLLEISDITVEFHGDYATASMRMDFIDPAGSLGYLEPETSGDISYFYFSGSTWKICGKDYYPWKD